METSNIYQKVNEYLAEWNPIGVPQDIAEVEYVDYVPDIIKVLSDKDELYICLRSFLDKIGIDEDNICIDLEKELCSRIYELQKLRKIGMSHEVFFRIINKERLNGICSWFIAYDDETKRICREVGIGDSGNVITKASYEGLHDSWLHSNLTIKDFVTSFPFEFVSKEEFVSVWEESIENNATGTSPRCFKQFLCGLFVCVFCIACRYQAAAVDGPIPYYWEQKVYGDSLSAFPSSLDYVGVYALGEYESPMESFKFLPYTILNDYWKTKHIFSFKDNKNQLVFEEYIVDGEAASYPLIYASITDSRICLKKKLHTGMKRADVLRLLKLKNVDDCIQKISITDDLSASTTFFFANGLLKKILIRTDKELLHNPDPVFECRHAGQVRGYTGKRLYAVSADPYRAFSPVCYVDEQGDTIVPYGRYSYCVSDSIAPVGFVLEENVRGITCINIEGQVMCRALVVDNFTPDYLSEGYFRIVNEEGLMGFADSLGHVVVTPQYKYALPFKGGKAKVTYTGHKNDPYDEHWEWVSDDWFYIDYQGKRVPSETKYHDQGTVLPK